MEIHTPNQGSHSNSFSYSMKDAVLGGTFWMLELVLNWPRVSQQQAEVAARNGINFSSGLGDWEHFSNNQFICQIQTAPAPSVRQHAVLLQDRLVPRIGWCMWWTTGRSTC
jgi:hypothetical protein